MFALPSHHRHRLGAAAWLLVAIVAAGALAGRADGATSTVITAGIPEGMQPFDVAVAADGSAWFTGPGSGAIGRVTPAGTVTIVTEGISPDATPTGVAIGPDGNVWYADYAGGRIGRVTPAGTVTEFSDGLEPADGPIDIAAGADGNLWFTAPDGGAIGRITPAGQITRFTDGIGIDGAPERIAAGPDGALWFSDPGADAVGRATTAGGIAEMPVPGAGPIGIAAGADGNLWFAAHDAGALGRLAPAGGQATLLPLAPGPGPVEVAPSPDGRIWFARLGATVPEAVAADGSALAPQSPSGGLLSAPIGSLAVAPDGAVWATAPGQDAIMRLVPDPPVRLAPPAPPEPARTGGALRPPGLGRLAPTAIGTTTATLNATIEPRGSWTTVDIEYGRTRAYGTRLRHAMNAAPGGPPSVTASRTLIRLDPAAIYHYRLTATSAGGRTVVSGSFATLPVPAVSRLRVSRGAISLRANAPGILRIVVQRVTLGRWAGTRCAPASRARARSGACLLRTSDVGTIRRALRAPGAASIPFRGRVAGRALPPGAYRLRARLAASWGQGDAATVLFRVPRR